MPAAGNPSTEPALTVIVLAAGKGTRMRSELPKVLHQIGGRPMVLHALDAAAALSPSRRVVVVGPDMELVSAAVAPHPTMLQAEQRGTADAVKAARALCADATGDTLILYGDTPLLRPQTLARLRAARSESGTTLSVLGFRPADPGAYGRLVLAADGSVERIVEAADASEAELAIDLCNSGVFCVAAERLFPLLDQVRADNAKGEFYLTDIVALARAEGGRCAVVEAPADELMGVNSRAELALAERILQDRLRAAAMAAGTTLIAPETVFLSADTRLGRDTVIGPFVVFGPEVTVGDHVEIRSFSHIEGAVIADGAIIGPFARLRPGASIGDGAHIGNFVEIKKSTIEAGAKINHLAYVGDARIGEGANIGAGTITCNYDGFMKHFTEIGAGAFIGSNSSLVAPVKVGARAIIGAGSVVTQDVADNALAVARGRQTELPGWAERFRKAHAHDRTPRE